MARFPRWIVAPYLMWYPQVRQTVRPNVARKLFLSRLCPFVREESLLATSWTYQLPWADACILVNMATVPPDQHVHGQTERLVSRTCAVEPCYAAEPSPSGNWCNHGPKPAHPSRPCHSNLLVMILTVALVPGCDSPWTKSNISRHIPAGTSGLGIPVDVSHKSLCWPLSTSISSHFKAVMAVLYNLCLPELALAGAHHQVMGGEPAKELAKMFCVFLHGTAGDEHIIHVDQEVIEVAEDFVHHPLKRLSSILKAERHSKELKRTKRRRDSCLRNVSFLYRYLMISFDEVYLAEELPSVQSCGKVGD